MSQAPAFWRDDMPDLIAGRHPFPGQSGKARRAVSDASGLCLRVQQYIKGHCVAVPLGAWSPSTINMVELRAAQHQVGERKLRNRMPACLSPAQTLRSGIPPTSATSLGMKLSRAQHGTWRPARRALLTSWGGSHVSRNRTASLVRAHQRALQCALSRLLRSLQPLSSKTGEYGHSAHCFRPTMTASFR